MLNPWVRGTRKRNYWEGVQKGPQDLPWWGGTSPGWREAREQHMVFCFFFFPGKKNQGKHSRETTSWK